MASATEFEWKERSRYRDRVTISWVAGTVLLGSFVVWGVIVNDRSLILNAGIGLAVIQFLETFNLVSRRHSFGIAGALALHALGVVEWEALGGLSLYSYLDYWDVLTHSAGVFILTIVLWSVIVQVTKNSTISTISLSDRMVMVWVIFLGLAVSGGWEMIEYLLQIYVGDPVLQVGGIDDHMKDMAAGLFGGIVAAGWITMIREDPPPVCPYPSFAPQQPQLPPGNEVQEVESYQPKELEE